MSWLVWLVVCIGGTAAIGVVVVLVAAFASADEVGAQTFVLTGTEQLGRWWRSDALEALVDGDGLSERPNAVCLDGHYFVKPEDAWLCGFCGVKYGEQP